MNSLTMTAPVGWSVGDRVTLSIDTNRIRRRVECIVSATTARLSTHIRPSKGYRRHVRREKAAARR